MLCYFSSNLSLLFCLWHSSLQCLHPTYVELVPLYVGQKEIKVFDFLLLEKEKKTHKKTRSWKRSGEQWWRVGFSWLSYPENSLQKVYWEVLAGLVPTRKWRKWDLAERILNHDAVARKVSVDPMGSSEAGMVLQHCPELSLKIQAFVPPASTSHWIQAQSWERQLPTAKGNFQEGTLLWSVSCQHSRQKEERVPWSWRELGSSL